MASDPRDARVIGERRGAQLERSRPGGLGLRVQITVALAVGFGLTVLLLGLTTARLGARAIDADRIQSMRAVAFAIAEIDESGAQHRALERMIESQSVLGAELVVDGTTYVFGTPEGAQSVDVTLGDRTVRMYLRSEQSNEQRSLPGLLFLYVGITAAAVLLFVYVLLTRAIVRPVEALTTAATQLASGKETRVAVRGASEVAGLATAFNEMQAQLAAERGALTDRLAELERTTQELESTQASLVRSEKMASVGRLAAGIAHEIGNPLSAILGLLELVGDGDLSLEEQREFLRRAQKETERIGRIIRDLLDFARSEPDGAALSGSCDLTEVVEDAVRLIGPQKDLRQITIERRFAEDVPHVRGDAARLAQVVLNLLLNAADAISGEGTISLDVTVEDEHVRLTVQDTGPGIAPEVIDHLFEPFVTTKPVGRGTGLGLAVAHTLVEGFGGTLDAANAPEGGARFALTLPVA
ncbi:MAG: ATP-binding protein [Sandaracinaceae bacterium]